MTFLHKLAQRLARLKGALVMGLVATSACELPPARMTAPPGPATKLHLSPKSLPLLTNQTTQFLVVGLTATDDTATVAVTWSVTGGSIIDTSSSGGRHYGRYQSPSQPGTYRIVARSTTGGLADSAVVSVSTVPVAAVGISPASASVPAGQTLQLTATPQDSTGAPLGGRVVTWATSNAAAATVTGSGLVTGVAAGTATITATSEGRSGTAAITVTAPGTTPPGTVTDLAVGSVTDSSVMLSFTEVNDGTGQPASYDIRWAVGTIAWGSAPSVTRGNCTTPVAGSAIGARRSCTVLGLAAATGYQFQLIAFRGTLNVNAVFGGLSNVANGTTAASTAPVASVTVSPAAASVLVGQTVPLTAILRDAAGNLLSGRVVSWTTSALAVATVTGSGLVAGVAVGTATITATSEGQSGTAAITVNARSGVPIDTIFAEGFESGNLSVWEDGVDPTRQQVLTDPTLAHSGSHVLEVTYPAGSDGGWLTHWFMPGYDSVYVSAYFRFAPNWQGDTKLLAVYGSRTDNQWSAIGQAGNCPNGTNFFHTAVVRATGTLRTEFYTYYLGMQRQPNGVTCYGLNGDAVGASYVPPLVLSLDVWHHIEFWVKLNTPGQANASQTFWLDGVQRGSWSGFSFRSSTILALNSVSLEFSNGGAPQTQKLYVDDVLVTTSKP